MPRGQHRDPALIQVLSLYLLLLAFFVLLFNLSRAEHVRSKAVTSSLTSTFAADGAVGINPEILTSVEGDALAEADIGRNFGLLVKTAIPVAEVRIVRPGRLLQIRFPVGELFDDSFVDIRDDRLGLVRKIAKSVAAAPAGLRYDMEIRIGRRASAGVWRSSAELPIARAGRLAQALISAGAPPGTVAGGITERHAGWIRFDFHVRSRKEGRLFLDPLVLDDPS